MNDLTLKISQCAHVVLLPSSLGKCQVGVTENRKVNTDGGGGGFLASMNLFEAN